MIADVFAATSFDSLRPRDPALIRMFGGGESSLAGARVTVKDTLGYSPIFRAVNLIGNAVAKCKPIIYERTEGGRGRDKRRAMDHPSWRPTVRRANQLMSAGMFRKTITVNAILEGNGIAYVARKVNGAVEEYIPLLPDRTGMAVFDTKIGEDSPFPSGGNVMYWTLVAGRVHWLLPENIIHIRNLTYNGVWGLNVNELMRETLGLGIAARDAGSRFYGQGMMSSGVLYMPPGMKDEMVQETFVKGIKEQSQGLGRASRLLILEEGAKYEKLSVDPNVAQALETRQFSVREIANIIGCQSHKLGDTGRTSYASLEQSNQEHLDDDIDPWLMWWEESLEEVALTESQKEDGTFFVECNRKALLRTDLAARTAYYTAGVNGGWLSANSILRTEGDDPIGDQGDLYRWPINMIPADQAGEVSQHIARPSDVKSSDRVADYRSVAMYEAARLIKRVCREACERAANGGADFLSFLESIESQCREPAPLRPQLTKIGAMLADQFDQFTRAPYSAADLNGNVADAAESIRSHVTQHAHKILEEI